MKKKHIGKGCYWCGKKPSTDEHVPPKNLFESRDKLITVPACKKHNNDFSKLDERMEQYMKMICAGSPKIQLVKSLKKLNRPESQGLKSKITNTFLSAKSIKEPNGKIKGFEITILEDDFRNYLEKIIRGLCYHTSNRICLGKKFYFDSNLLRNSNPISSGMFKDFNLLPIKQELSEGVGWLNPSKNNFEELIDRGIFKYHYLNGPNFFYIRMTFYNHIEFNCIIDI
jgi:hypothetical protein